MNWPISELFRMSCPLDALADGQRSLLKASTSFPPTAIRIQSKGDKSTQIISAEVIIADGNSQAFVSQLDIPLEKLKALEASLQHYFQKSDCHKLFPSVRTLKSSSDTATTSLQRYIDEVLKIPGICIFQPFVETFSLDLTHFLQPPPKPSTNPPPAASAF
jgi:hypothetical protein